MNAVNRPLGVTLLATLMMINGVSFIGYPLSQPVAEPHIVMMLPPLGVFSVISALGLIRVKGWGLWSAVAIHSFVIAYNIFVALFKNDWSVALFAIFFGGGVILFLLSGKTRSHFL